VRPTDENQTGSRRPNLMSSSRRASGEINILAMLDGQSGRPLSRRFLAWPRIAWVGGAGIMSCALLGGLAWLLHDPVGGGFEGRAVHATLEGASGTPVDAPDDMLPNPALRVAAPSVRGAAIVESAAPDDVAPPPRFHPDEPALREERLASVTRPPIAAAVPPAAAPLTVHATPRQASKPAPVPTPGPAAKVAAKTAARTAIAQRPAVIQHHRRGAIAAKQGNTAAGVDNDVALISAIIQHVNKRGELKDGPDCGEQPCPATMTKR